MKRLATALGLSLLATPAVAEPITLVNAVTTNQSTPPITAKVQNPTAPDSGRPFPFQAFQATISGTGVVSATIQIVSSLDGTNWNNYGSSFSVSGTTSGSATAYGSAPFLYWGATVASITGTGATVTVKMVPGP